MNEPHPFDGRVINQRFNDGKCSCCEKHTRSAQREIKEDYWVCNQCDYVRESKQ